MPANFTPVVDLTRLKQLHCGLGQFAMHLGRTLQAEAPPGVAPLFITPPGTQHVLRAPTSEAPSRTIPRTASSRWWWKETPRRLLRPVLARLPGLPRGEVWHTIDHLSAYGPFAHDTPVILTIHDLNFPADRTAGQIRRSLRLLQARVDRATLLTTGSHFAAAQIRQHLDLRGKDLQVIYHGLCVRPERVVPRPAFAPAGRFLFSIGEFRRSKNFHVLVDFLAKLPGDLQLVIAGNCATPYGEEVQARVQRLGLSDRVILPGVVSDDQRHWLYEHCQAFVFPSLAEGFGLPAIEGMSFGKPVFLAEATSLPEIGGDLACYWRDFDPSAMREVYEVGLERFRADPAFADRLRQHAARFTWPAAARHYLDLYCEVAGERAPAERRPAMRRKVA